MVLVVADVVSVGNSSGSSTTGQAGHGPAQGLSPGGPAVAPRCRASHRLCRGEDDRGPHWLPGADARCSITAPRSATRRCGSRTSWCRAHRRRSGLDAERGGAGDRDGQWLHVLLGARRHSRAFSSIFAAIESGNPLDGVLIETTGMADPVPIVRTLRQTPEIARHCSLNGVVTLCDAKNLLNRLRELDEDGGDGGGGGGEENHPTSLPADHVRRPHRPLEGGPRDDNGGGGGVAVDPRHQRSRRHRAVCQGARRRCRAGRRGRL